MVDYKEILRLSHNGYSLRQIAASTGHSHHTVKNVLELAEKYCIYRTDCHN
ncbi:MAG: integrase [Ruminococcus sp.]|nr:integrase [Ruminococcus sp.]